MHKNGFQQSKIFNFLTKTFKKKNNNQFGLVGLTDQTAVQNGRFFLLIGLVGRFLDCTNPDRKPNSGFFVVKKPPKPTDAHPYVIHLCRERTFKAWQEGW